MKGTVVSWTLVLLVSTLRATGQKTYKCNFEKDICSFLRNSPANTENWKIGQGVLNSKDAGPSIDHTYGNSSGKYLYVNVSAARINEVKLISTSAFRQDYCIKFWYHMFGPDIGSLKVRLLKSSREFVYFTREKSQGDRWKQARFTAPYRTYNLGKVPYTVVFAVRHMHYSKYRGDIALDDIEFIPNGCDSKSAISNARELCSFDDGPCGYTSPQKSSGLMWKRLGVGNSRLSTMAEMDHTLGTGYGGYFYATSASSTNEKAILSSPKYSAPKSPTNCLHFYYYLHGDSAGWTWWGYKSVKEAYMEVYLDYSKSGPPLWMRAKNNTRHRVWSYAEVKMEIKSRYQFDFLAFLTTGVEATWALDDVRLLDGSCPDTGACDFEEDKCTWTDGQADIVWLRKNGASGSNNEKGPPKDKTTDSANGYYIFINIENKDPDLKARLESEPFPASTKSSCINFWYFMSGSSGLGSLRIRRNLENVTETTLWILSGHQDDKWLPASVASPPSVLGSQIIIEGTTGKGNSGFMAVDDIVIKQGDACKITPATADPRYEAETLMACDFNDLHFCNWKQNTTTNLAWIFGNVTIVESTGPKQPYGGKGSYIFVPSHTNETQTATMARLQSPVISSFYPDSGCFSFYYYMFGAHVGELRVVMVPNQVAGVELGRQVMWRRKGTQPDRWINFRDSLNITEGDYRLDIEADGGSGYAGDIAIDEVTMRVGQCVNTGVCDFESSLCGWTIESSKNSTFYWFRTANESKGPSIDHTTLSKAGYYLMAVMADGNKMGDITSLVSPKYKKNLGTHCLTFWYYRPGYGTGKIGVYPRVGKELKTLLWSATNDVGKLWHFAQVNVSQSESFRIVIQAERGKGNTAGEIPYRMAIDDILIKNSVCTRPADCDFNQDYCSYFLNSTSDFAWLLGTGRVVNPQIIEKPPLAAENGMFAYVDFTSPNLTDGQQAVLVSEIVDSSPSIGNCFSFNYFLSYKGTDPPMFAVGHMILNNMDQEMQYDDYGLGLFNQQTGPAWKNMAITVGNVTHKSERSQLYFKAIRGKSPSAFIALDDVTFTDGACPEATTVPPVLPTEMPKTDFSCNFDDGTFCLWTTQELGTKWAINEPKMARGNMPKYDNTQKNYKGRYAYVMGDNTSPKKASLVSAAMPNDWKGRACISFWYFMRVGSEQSNRLTLFLANRYVFRTNYEELFKQTGDRGYRWRHAYVATKRQSVSRPTIKFNFTAEVITGVIALDDLEAKKGNCELTSKVCTFDGENDMCGYVQDLTNTASWEIRSGEDDEVANKMPDHTTHSLAGQYLYISFNTSTTTTEQTSRIYSPKIPVSDVAKCVNFYYHIFNVKDLGFNVYISTDNGASDPQWSNTISQSLLWHGSRVTAVSKTPWQVMFEVGVQKGGYGQVALDDISVDVGECPDPGSCDFEKDDCMWENVRSPYNATSRPKDLSAMFTDDLDWVRHIGEDYFGPSVDNTRGTPEGFYLLLDTRFAKPNQRAVYLSERLQTPSGSCFQFWYSIPNKLNASKLNIHTSSNFKDTYLAYTLTNNTNEEWKKEQVTILPRVTEDKPFIDYWILLEGVVGTSNLGYLAVDDLKIIEGTCDEQTTLFDCQGKGQIPAKDVCNFRKECPNGWDEANCGTCDFESGTCGWKNVARSYVDFHWVRSISGREGLEYDHTKQNSSGYFMVAAATTNSYNYRGAANLRSSTLRNAFTTCTMEFWYNILGQVDFSAHLRRNGIRTNIWVNEDKSPYVWTRGETILSRIPRKFEIEFTAEKKPRENVHVAVDDVALLGCESPGANEETYCPPDQFNCKNALCIPMDKTCDYADDCGNFEDERPELCVTSRCNFDTSLCDWTFDNSSVVTWVRRKPFSSITQGPTRDHTTGTESGQFLYLAGRVNPKPTRIIGPSFVFGTDCKMRFFYDVRGTGESSLQIKTRTAIGGVEKVVWTREEPTDGFFFVDNIVTFKEAENFQVIIEGQIEISAGRANYLALDDISFGSKCVQLTTSLPTLPPEVTTISPTILCFYYEFRCSSLNQCVNKTQVCDFKKDCDDGSDELKCGQCDFVDDMCGLVNTGSGFGYRWKRQTAGDFSSTKNSTVPGADSHDNPLGYFAVLTSTYSTGYIYNPGIMRTPRLGEMSHSCKLQFHYHFNVRGSLKVFIGTIGYGSFGRQQKWVATSNTGKEWQFVTVPIGNYPAGRVIEFHGKVSYPTFNKVYQDIAIDNIKLINCDPSVTYNTTLNCTFDVDECGWHTDNTNSRATWSRVKKSAQQYGPEKDHTGKNGYFLYIYSSTVYYMKGDRARLVSLKQPTSPTKCFTLWYHMFGQDVGTLNIIIKTDDGNDTIWSKSNSQGNIWRQAQRTLHTDKPYSVVIEGIVGSFRLPVIAIDDVIVYDEVCPTPVECDFESDFCGWEPSGWILQIGKGNRPMIDHTSGSMLGKYASLTENEGSLMSSMRNYTRNGHCFKFWYFIEGDRSAKLSIIRETQEVTTGSGSKIIWSDAGQPQVAGQWVHAMTNIDDRITGSYVLYINGTRKNVTAAVALDDIRLADGACPPYGSCTFEEDFCTWRNLGPPHSSGLVWIRNSGKTPSRGSGPTTDHTTGSPEGSYIYLDSAFAKGGSFAVLESENLHMKAACVKFWFHMNGRGGSISALYFNLENNTATYLSTNSGNFGNKWTEYRYFSKLPDSYRIRIQGTIGYYSNGDIAVDDITIQENTCEVPVTTTPPPTEQPPLKWNCDFEAGTTCSWNASDSWVIQDGRRALVNKEGPSADHTKGNALGHYAYFHPLTNGTHNFTSETLTSDTNDYCFVFWYYLHSTAQARLQIFSRQYQQDLGPLWSKSESGGTEWKRGSFYFEKRVKMNIVIQPYRSSIGTGIGDIAIDDLVVTEGTCPMIKGQPCDFEAADICGFKLDSPDEVTWKRVLASKVVVGPKKDKTYNTPGGHYMIAYPSVHSRIIGDNKAWLIMPNVPSTGSKQSCVKFWYQINGEDVISLSLYVRTPGGQMPSYSLWSHSAKRGEMWRIGQRTIDVIYTHEIIFEASSTRGDKGYIALDDVLLLDGRCPPPGSCDFETDLCSWQNAESGADIEWIRNSGPTPTNGTGPEVDTTIGTKSGSYIYLNANDPKKKRNLVGILESEFFSLSSNRCISFWAHMNGSEMGSLSVNLSYYDEDRVKIFTESSWTVEGNQGPKWFLRRLSIDSTKSPVHDEYQILLTGMTKGNLSDIAVDDIDVSNGLCYIVPDEAFDCKDGTTPVNSSKVCDFVKDCLSGEDEANCGKCDFEHGQCGWNDATTNYYQKWERMQGNSDGPAYDNTFNDSLGYFMISRTTYYSYQSAILQSPDGINQFKRSYASCVMKFYYYMKENSKPSLSIRKRLTSSTTGTVWQQKAPIGKGWQLGIAYLGTTERPFYVEIEMQSSYQLTYVAIDDISFENCGLPAAKNKCRSDEYKCYNSRCIPRDFMCDLTDDCGDGSDEIYQACWYYPKSCTFDTYGDCEWTTSGKRHNWTIANSASSRMQYNTGPIVDHTKGISTYSGGKYLVLKRSQSSPKYNQSFYISPNYRVNRIYSTCDLRFYYYMYGKDVANLKVHVEFEKEGWNWKQMFSREGSLGQSWNRGFVRVFDRKPFQFIIEGVLGPGYETAIAIDDLSLSYGCQNYSGELPRPMSTPLPVLECKISEFRCLSGKIRCILKSKACDFVADCDDASDEVNCGPCDFENGMCGWSDNSWGRFRWDVKNGTSDTINGPTFDSKNAKEGHFAYVKYSYGSYNFDARLLSPPLPPTSTHCVVSFWYYLDGNNTNSLKLMFTESEPGYTRSTYPWEQIQPQGPQWNLQEVKLSQSRRGSKLTFTSSPKWLSIDTVRDAAIDDITFLNCNPNTLYLDCDFDDDSFHDGFCFWTNSPDSGNNNLKWLRAKGSTNTTFTGPSSDHTTGHGYYLYIKQLGQLPGKIAQLVSPTMPMNYPEGDCFTFWYHMYGNHIGKLELRKKTKYFVVPQWTQSGSYGKQWLHAEVYIRSVVDYTLYLEATTRWGRQGNIAVDDFKLLDGPCPKTTTCDFENDFCGWFFSNEGLATWERSQGSGNFSVNKPQVDHTTNTEDGYFIYMPRKKPGGLARLDSPFYNNVGDVCVKFWYSMFGDQIGTLALYQKTNEVRRQENSKTLWLRSGDHVGVWKQGRVTFKSLPSFYISIEAQIGLQSQTGWIALDDISVTHGACSEPASCTFEIDTCGWHNFNAFLDFDWVRRAGEDQIMGGGPLLDRTTFSLSGHYMYAYLAGQPANSKSMLISEDLDIYPTYCFSLYYNMFNATNVSLHVQQMILGMGWADITNLKASSVTSDEWKFVELNVSVVDSGEYFALGFLVEMESDIDNGTDAGVAVDDISLKKEACGAIVTTTLPPPTPTPYPSTKYDCDFENGFCDDFWRNDDELSGKWSIVTGHDDNKLTRPHADHTTQSTSGHYLTLNDSAKSYLQYNKARLISADSLPANPNGTCFKFWYHMYGNDAGAFYLKVQDGGDEDKYETVWSKQGSRSPSWIYEQVHIVKSYNHKIVLEGAGKPTGDISLDDFSLNHNACPPREVCDVEQDYCGFSNDPQAKIQWLRGAGFNTSGPDIDHTYGTKYGNFFYIDVKQPINTGETAILESGPYPPAKKCMRFWYYLYGQDTGTLDVYTKYSDTRQKLWTEEGENTTDWQASEVVLDQTMPLPFTYAFQFTAGELVANGTIGIDDVTVKDNCPPLGTCNFEEDMCLWGNNPGTDLQWLRGSGEIVDVGPGTDVTFGNQFGTYIYVHIVTKYKGKLLPAELISPAFPPTKKRCINFWHFRNGTDLPTLTVLMRDALLDGTIELMQLKGEKMGKWMNEQVEIDGEDSKNQYHVIFQAEMTNKERQFIALDDITVTEKECDAISPEIPNFACDGDTTFISDDFRCDFYPDCTDGADESACGQECDFESDGPDACNWINKGNYYNSWNRTKATSTTVPNMDHTQLTVGEGYYLLLNARNSYSSVLAEFTSPAQIQSAPSCRLFFWYYVTTSYWYSQDILTVFYDSYHQTKRTKIFQLSGDQGKVWKLGEAVVGRIVHRFQVGFLGSDSSSMVIALDDLKFENCALDRVDGTAKPCGNDEYQCKNGNCIPLDLVCDFTDDCGDYSDENVVTAKCSRFPGRCDFERDQCDWKAATETNYKWERTQNVGSSFNRKYVRDHTKNSIDGTFMYASNTFRTTSNVARITSPIMESVNSTCKLRFYYTYIMAYKTTDYQTISDIGPLSVYLRFDEIGAWEPIFMARTPVGQYYEKAVLSLGHITDPYEVIIESKVGTKKDGGWAIDDISFTDDCAFSNESLVQELTTTTTERPNLICEGLYVPCPDGNSCGIICDFVPQCSDGTDEAKCGTCSFDSPSNPTCGWSDAKLGRWVRQNGGEGMGPKSDVSGKGYYMYVSRKKVGAVSSEAVLKSIEFSEASSSCEISFYYYMSGLRDRDASLKLQMKIATGHTFPLWVTNVDRKNNWVNMTVGIGRRSAGWTLYFIATHIQSSGDIAIDEIDFPGCAPPGLTACQENDFHCGGNKCIDRSLVCDFNWDCPDGSDEKNCTAYYERCDFEGGNFCGWTHGDTYYKWLLRSGNETVEGQGPKRDHTIGDETGHFLLVPKAGSYSWVEYEAQLISALFKADTSKECKIRFWYHMFGQYLSNLTVNVQNAGINSLILMQKIASSAGDQWLRAEVPLTSKFNFQVVLVGVTSKDKNGEVAIDDISFSLKCIPMYTIFTTPIPTVQPSGLCNNKTQFQCDDNSCIPKSKVCNFIEDCPYGKDEKNCPTLCTFEDGTTCGWHGITTSGDGVEIKVIVAESAKDIQTGNLFSTLPNVDHTTNSSSGRYLLIHTNLETETGPLDEYRSPNYSSCATACSISFWYSSRTIYMKPLVALKTFDDSDIDMVEITTTSNKNWAQETIGIGRRRSNFSITVYKKGYMRKSDYITLDDIEFKDCALPQTDRDTCKGFSCQNKACIDSNLVCDMNDDCGDGSDELTCGKYLMSNFEGGFRFFRTVDLDVISPLKWELRNGTTPGHARVKIGPPFDHTYSTSSGTYVAFTKGKSGSFAQKAWLVSVVLSVNPGSECKMRLYYFMYGKDVNELNILTRTSDGGVTDLKWTLKGQVGNYWKKQEIQLDVTEPFEVIIEGKGGLYSSDLIAVDDVSFTPGCSYQAGRTLPTTPGTPTTPTTPIVPSGCKKTEFFCVKDKLCIPGEKKCDFRADCPDGSDEEGCVQVSCDFQNNLCGWTVYHKLKNTTRFKRSDDDAIYKWIPIQANDAHTLVNIKYRPERDHTWNSTEGWYLLADGAPGQNKDITSLVSSTISATNPRCSLDFWFYCGQWQCSLNVYMDKVDGDDVITSQPIWKAEVQMYGTLRTRRWTRGKIHLDAAKNYQMRFDAVRGFSPNSVYCLDDINFNSCPPPPLLEPEKTLCGDNEFMCNNRRCISSNLVCDFHNDCIDNSDESSFHCNIYVARCDFEHDLCSNWHLQPDKNLQWSLQSGVSTVYKDVPSVDHTTRTKSGRFVAVRAPYWSRGAKPQLYSDVLKGNVKGCTLRVWYNIIRLNGHAIEVHKRFSYDVGEMKLVATLTSDVQDFWNMTEIDLFGDQRDFEVVFVPKLATGSGSVSVDDISLTPECILSDDPLPGKPTGSPPPFTECAKEGKFTCGNGQCYTHLQRCNFIDDCKDFTDELDCGNDCDFEAGQCGWYNAPGHRAEWKIRSGKLVYYSKLETDNTYKNKTGHYMTPMGFRMEGDTAQLQSKLYVASGPNCKMSLYYYFAGKDSGKFIVKLKFSNKTIEDEFLILSMIDKNKGEQWNKLEVDIKARRYFAIIIESVFGTGYRTTTAIDDIKFDSCSPDLPPVECSYNQFTCTTIPQCINVWEYCDGKYDCKDKSDELQCDHKTGDCDFDSENWMAICNWTAKAMDFDWSRAKASHSDKTGPSRNHNERKEGYYLFINSSKQAEGETAAVAAPVFKASEGKCHLRFWYFMKGSQGMGALQVLTEGIAGQVRLLWREQGAKGDKWLQGHVLVGNGQDYQVIFEGVVGSDAYTDIAIDDVSFTHGCEEGGTAIIPTGEPELCTLNQFRCRTGKAKCISRSWLCDCAKDCADGSDEEGCTTICSTTGAPKEVTSVSDISTGSTVTVIPQKDCLEGWKRCNDQVTCIPGILLCDGIDDCPDGSDEKQGCPEIPPCGSGFYFCKDRAYPPCLHRDKLCDKHNDCNDGSDESLCDVCPPTFCQNKGNCSIEHRVPVCTCKTGYSQNRCGANVLKPEIEKPVPTYESANTAWIPGVVIGTILLIAIVFTIWYKRNTNVERQRLPHAVDNPMYGVNLETLNFSELNKHVLPEADSGSTSIENPLFSYKSEQVL